MSETYVYQPWPKWMFTADGQKAIFDSPEDVPEGWMTRDELEAGMAAPKEAATIPDDWGSLHWKTQASLAKTISGEEPANAAAAKAIIEAEVARRAALIAEA